MIKQLKLKVLREKFNIVINYIMIEEKDIKKIGEEVGKIIEDNITPQFEGIYKRLDGVDGRLGGVEGRLDGVDGRLGRIEATMVTKSYLDDKLADLEGNLISKLRKEDEKVNRLIEILKNKSLLTAEDIQQFKEFQIFPKV